jgi:ribose transport system ATP-binding protein
VYSSDRESLSNSTGAAPVRAAALEVRHLSKSFGGAPALRDVELRIEAGEVHGLLGENGSGKSTVIKILGGYHAPEPGAELRVGGEQVRLPLRPGKFRDLGMSFVHQELGLLPGLTVLENLWIVELCSMQGVWIDWRHARADALRIFKQYGVSFDPDAPVARLSQAERAILAIVRAAVELEGRHGDNGARQQPGGLLVLDEPTVYLSEVARIQLIEIMRTIVERGGSVLFVSHDLEEVLDLTDRTTVLRDGRVVGTVLTHETTQQDLVSMIIGRHVEASAPRSQVLAAEIPSEEGVSVEGLTGGPSRLRDVSFIVHPGEILGVTGLGGSGFEDVPYMLFGAADQAGGSLTVRGRRHSIENMSPPRAIKLGFGLVPANRLRDGCVASLSVMDNVMLQVLDQYVRPWGLSTGSMRAAVPGVLREFDVRTKGPDALYRTLSGGNQQKALLAKWIQTAPDLLLLHEPTQGVDVGARMQISSMLRDLASRGVAILCASSDHEQLESICGRVLVFKNGTVVDELVGTEVRKHTITARCLATVEADLPS